MDADSLIRISEFIHAIKVFIAAANRLKDDDMKHLEKIVEMLEQGNGGDHKVNISQFEKAELIMQQIRQLTDLKNSIDLPPECYLIKFETASGKGVIVSNDEIGTLSMQRLINEFKSSIDERIRSLKKEMEGI
ncbi:MAG: hypothetical protein K0Q48_1000 [Bacillota bacterium]|nr:hypothetical protein [Bacillota bacterium]